MITAVTTPTKAQDIKRNWYLFDIKGQTLGRQATQIAHRLMGKDKAYFVRNLDCGDYVVVVNAKDVKVSGKKEEKKSYARHSGYPGGFTAESLKDLRARRPEEVITRAVKGMLPNNRLRDRMLTRLYVFAGEEHTYGDKFKVKNEKLKVKNTNES